MRTVTAGFIVRAAASLVAFIAVMVLIGWWFDIKAFKTVLPNFTTMKANTAFCLVLTTAAVWLARCTEKRTLNSQWIWLLAGLTFMVAVLTLGEYVWGWNAHIDELLFRDQEHQGTVSPPGRFAPGTAVCFILLSIAIVWIDWVPLLSHAVTLITILVAGVGLVGYLYNLPTLYGAGRYSSMALHAVISFLALSIAVLAARPGRGVAGLIRESRLQGSPVRILLAGAVFLPICLGYLALHGQNRGWYGAEFTLALFSILLMVLTFALVWITGAARHRSDARRRVAEQDLHILNMELERRVEHRTAELKALNEELESFSYSVSHDLRAPLHSIDSFSQFLVDDYGGTLNAEAKRYLSRIRANAQRMRQLIGDLLALARLSRVSLECEVVDMSRIAEEVIAGLREAHAGRQVTVEIQPAVHAEGDARLLRIVLENLFGNAWKFTSKTGNPKIQFGTLNERNVYFVKDNGAGFDMQYAGQLFAPFQRLHTVKEFEGTGIGLATVQRIVRRHEGKIWAEGEVGRGAVFYFALKDGALA